MLRRAFALMVASAFAGALGACGGTDREPKRTLDARNEAIRFFAADAPFVALIDPVSAEGSDPGQVIDDLAAVPALAVFGRKNLAFAADQGLEVDDVDSLFGKEDVPGGVEASQLAVGVDPTAIPTEDALIVIVTDRPRATATRVEEEATAAGMSRRERLDGAQLYEGDSAALAVRDGVVVVAETTEGVRHAIRLRDSDPGSQLDDGQVNSVLDGLPEEAPLLVYADVGALTETDPTLAGLASGPRAWVAALAEAGISVTPGSPTEVELVAAIDGSVRDDVPLEERPEQIALGRGALTRASAGEAASASDFRDALLKLAPAELTLSATSDELKILLTTSR